MAQLDAPVATLIASALAAFVALITIVVTKEQKVSEFRQAWINSLRDDVAEAISAASTMSIVMQLKNRPDLVFAEWARFGAALARVELRLNLKEASHQALAEHIHEAELLVQRIESCRSDYNQDEWLALQAKVVLTSQELLKIEWNRVREGELFYRVIKITLTIISVLVPLAILASYVCPA